MDSFEGMDSQKPNSPPRRAKARENERQKLRALDQKPWAFTYEALTHVHSLRLFLFNSVMPVPWRCVSLQATLASESPISSSPVVLCEFKVTAEGESQRLFVPLPVCLVDYSASLAAVARSDHIEIKLKLLSSGGSFVDDLSLLGYTYRGEAIIRDGGIRSNSRERDESAFSLTSDAELLSSSNQGVTFHCRNCSATLTNQPISCFRALPSTEWRELADHWFGMCCCRDGVKTKSMMTRFEEFSTPTIGVCLVGSITCIVHRHDLVGSVVDQDLSACRNKDALCTPFTEKEDKIRPADGLDVEISCKGNGDRYVALSTDPLAWVEEVKPLKDAVPPPSTVCSHNVEEESVESATCCTGHGSEVLDDDLSDQSSKTETLANGFMNAFPSSKLTPFNCRKCADLIGAFCGGTEGLQLFKCHISSDLSAGGPSDIFRFHTLERVFSNELFSNAEEDSSYRYVVRDLSSRLPLLQLVLINHESWVCSGSCVEDQSLLSESKRMRSLTKEDVFVETGPENDVKVTFPSQECELMNTLANGKSSPVFLEPVMKLMFCDTSSFNAEELSEVESWGQKNQSDDIYMLGSEVKALSRSLQANRKLFPESCAAFQQFHLSFLAR